MKKLYYTIELELESINEYLETTGNKTIMVYEMVDDEPKLRTRIDAHLADKSVDLIQDWVDTHDMYKDDNYKFILL